MAPPAELAEVVEDFYVGLCRAGSSGELSYARNGLRERLRGATGRRSRRLASGTGGDPEPPAAPGEPVDEVFAHLCELVRALPAQNRRLLLMRKVYGRTQPEIAAVLKTSERYVEANIAAATRQCHQALAGEASIRRGEANRPLADNVVVLRDPRRRADEACEWVARIDRGLKENETRDFQRWMSVDPENEAQIQTVAVLWDEMDMLHRLAELYPFPDFQPEQPPPQWLLTACSIGAIVLACAAGVWLAL